MRRSLIPAIVAAVAILGASGAQADKSWCTDAHMQKMDEMVAKLSDAAAKQSAEDHLSQSKAAMKTGNTDGCIAQMKLAHKAMGM